jgi:hypothetical protein
MGGASPRYRVSQKLKLELQLRMCNITLMELIPEAVSAFLVELAKRDSTLKPQLEPGGEKAGNWWIDLKANKRITIEWRPKLGFGLTLGEVNSYGEGPSEIFTSPARAAHRVMQLIAPVGNSSPTALRAVRELYGITQIQIATRLKKKQAAISRLETRNDSRIETLSKYVHALGGKMEIRVVFPDSQLPIYQTTKSKS